MFALKKRSNRSRIFALLLALIMTLGVIPANVLTATVNGCYSYDCEVDYEKYEEDEKTKDNTGDEIEIDIKTETSTPSALEVSFVSLAAEYITVYISFEGSTLGHGFYIEPTRLRVSQGTNALDASHMVLAANGASANTGAWITRIQGFNVGTANPPDFIRDAINANPNLMFTATPNADGSIGSGDFFMWAGPSGWMFTINHVLSDDGAGAHTLVDGDVIRWQFSLLAGPDLGVVGAGTTPDFIQENKSDLIRALFRPGVSWAAYQHAIAIITRLNATAVEVSDALTALATGVLPEMATEVSLSVADAHTFISEEPLTVTVANKGMNAANGLTVELSGADASAFEINPAAIPTIAAGESATFTIAPASGLSMGTYTAVVTVLGYNITMQRFTVRFTVVGVVQSGAFTFTGVNALPPGLYGAPWRLYNTGKMVIGEGVVGSATAQANVAIPWNAHRASIHYIVIEGPIQANPATNSVQHLFSNLRNLRSIEGLEHLDTSTITNMANMFAAATQLQYRPVNFVSIQGIASWDTSSVTNMASMFSNLISLKAVDVANWDVSNVTAMNSVFSGLESITSLDVSNWDTSNATTLNSTFLNTHSLTSLDVSGWDVSNVTNFTQTFGGMQNITSLDLSSWDTSSATTFTSMFTNTHSLVDLNISGWDTSSATAMGPMFSNARSLTSLDLSGWDVSRVTNFASMFANTWALEELNISGWEVGGNISANMSINNMFMEARSLTSLDLSGWDVRRATSMNAMFQNAYSLESLNLDGWDTSSTTFISNVLQPTMLNLFEGAASLREITLGEKFEFKTAANGTGANLPAIPVNPYLTGYWANVGAGTIGNPEGIHKFTSAQLIHADNADYIAGETWVWQPDLYALPPSPYRVALNEVIEQAQSRNRASYTPTSWAAMQVPLNTALALPIRASQAQADSARTGLTAAINSLVLLTTAPRWQTVMYDSLRWLHLNSPSGLSGEWAVLALARAGIDDASWYSTYLSNLANALPLTGTGAALITDSARVAIALTALDENAASFNGHNLTTAFASRPAVNMPNADIFSLIAINSGNHSINTQQYIDGLLASQLPDGSWAWSGDWGDADITAMAIQALAPFRSNASVNSAINDAVSWLATEAFLWGGPEELAQITVALTAVGTNPASYVTRMLEYFDHVTGGFRSSAWYFEGVSGGGDVNQMSTQQAAHALVAYYRFTRGMNSLYNMSDSGEARTLQLLPTVVTPALPDNGGGDDNGGNNNGNGGGIIITPERAFISVDNSPRAGQPSVVFAGEYFELNPGETAYSLLHRIPSLSVVSNNGFVVSINGFGAFDDGPLSGWMYRVNGVFPDIAANQFTLQNGHRIEWVFTRDLGDDVGGGYISPPVPGPGAGIPVPDAPSVSTEVEADVTDGAAVADIAPETVDYIVAEALAQDAENIVISIANTEDAISLEVNLVVESLSALAENEITLTVQSYIATITLDLDTLVGLVYDTDYDLTVSLIVELVYEDSEALNPRQREIVGHSMVISLTLRIGDEYIRDFEGVVTVTIPYTPADDFYDYDLLTVFHLDYFGNIIEMEDSVFYNGFITFTTTHFSVFFVGTRGANYDIGYIYVPVLPPYEIMNAAVSRAEVVTMFWQLAGSPELITTGQPAFADVLFSPAIEWAARYGIVQGHGDGFFAPYDYVNAEQFAAILHRYAIFKRRVADARGTVYGESFVSPWALEAMQWVNSFATLPPGAITRAEIAEVLEMFFETEH